MSVVELTAAPMLAGEVWDRFEVLEPYRAEIVLGELVVTLPGSVLHGRVRAMLGALLSPQLPADQRAAGAVEWRVDQHDVVVMAPQPDLIVEVLSPTDANRLELTSVSRIEGKLRAAGR